jgi:flagella basal body P-ring formation protein FlgA
MSPTRLSLFVVALAADVAVSPARVAAMPAVPAAVAAALESALAISGARIDVTSYAPKVPAGCAIESAEVGRTIAASGRLAVKLSGKHAASACTGWAWIGVRVFARVFVTTRAVNEGDALDSATTVAEREIKVGQERLESVEGLVATRSIPRDAVVDAAHARAQGGRAGEPVKVVVTAGTLQVEQMGRFISCGKARACAVLPSGKHVEGALIKGRLVVRLP